jgi:hypothetical protein
MDLSLVECQADAIIGQDAGEPFGDIAEFENGRHRFSTIRLLLAARIIF